MPKKAHQQPATMKVSVSNFGPIKEGQFDLKPLTIFIGPNNSGKSYMALLIYALSRALNAKQEESVSGYLERGSEQQYPELDEWLQDITGSTESKLGDLPEKFQRTLDLALDYHVTLIEQEIVAALENYFAYDDTHELLPSENGQSPLSVRLTSNNKRFPLLTIQLGAKNKKFVIKLAKPNLRPFDVSHRQVRLVAQISEFVSSLVSSQDTSRVNNISTYLLGSTIINSSWSAFLERKGFPSQDAYYLPSARSGILQAWSIFASLSIQLLQKRMGYERIEIPRLQGVAGDFLQTLWDKLQSPETYLNNRMKPVLELLENHVFHGQVTFAESRPSQPLLLYTTGKTKVPLHRASSMVAELAPLDLWLENLLIPGDILIIDEPEAHLHPENQRLIARVLVRLVRAGVRVICPTHSSTILHQISNLIQANQLPDEVRQEEFSDLTEDDRISAEEVGVYLFHPEKGGTHIKEVPIEPGFGILEDEFIRVSEAIGDESFRISVAAIEGDAGE